SKVCRPDEHESDGAMGGGKRKWDDHGGVPGVGPQERAGVRAVPRLSVESAADVLCDDQGVTVSGRGVTGQSPSGAPSSPRFPQMLGHRMRINRGSSGNSPETGGVQPPLVSRESRELLTLDNSLCHVFSLRPDLLESRLAGGGVR